MKNKKIKLNLESIKTGPGVYQFFDKLGQILYVGKAKNLRNRVKSYFLRSEELLESRSEAIFQMVELVKKIKTIQTDSEIEALFLESQLINKLKPKYNSRQKDDKSFYVIEISKEEIPKVELRRVRNIDLENKKFYYFGPYVSGDTVKKALRVLRKIFPYANCSNIKFFRQKKLGKACLYGDLKLCSAPCEKLTISESKKQSLYLRDFLSGKKESIIQKLSIDMEVLSSMKKYEDAIIIRDKIFALKHLNRFSVGLKDSFDDYRSGSISSRIEAYDISNIAGEFAVGAMTVLTLGKIDKSEYKKFKIKTISGSNDLAMMQEMLLRRFKNDWPKPNLVIIDGGVNHLKIVESVVKKQNLNIATVSIAKGPNRDKNEFHYSSSAVGQYFQKNPELKDFAILARDEAHRFSRQYYRTLHRKNLLK
jgi:excinuclease ABC subunit C